MLKLQNRINLDITNQLKEFDCKIIDSLGVKQQ